MTRIFLKPLPDSNKPAYTIQEFDCSLLILEQAIKAAADILAAALNAYSLSTPLQCIRMEAEQPVPETVISPTAPMRILQCCTAFQNRAVHRHLLP